MPWCGSALFVSAAKFADDGTYKGFCVAEKHECAVKIIERIIDWTREQGIDSLVLHASDEGRALYERLGFIATTEMRFNR